MREIKFRAWDAEKEEMLAFEQVSHHPLFWFFESGKRLIPMQFTGLLDRNGVEIYEGDIVLTEKLVVKVVEWESLTMQPFGQYFEQFDEWEVIGNIYQNPELVPK